MMSKQNVKYQIDQILAKMPEEQLEALLSYLQQLTQKGVSAKQSQYVLKIMREDKDLLQKLAK